MPLLLALVLGISGCGPVLTFNATTEVLPGGAAKRDVTISCQPTKRFPLAKAELVNYLVLPKNEGYSRYDISPREAHLAGSFTSMEKLPVDFSKKTAGSGLLAQNHVALKATELELFCIYEYEERIDDIVEVAEAEEKLDETSKLLAGLATVFLKRQLGDDYDIDRLCVWFEKEFPPIANRLYRDYREIRRAKRGGLGGESEVAELEGRLRLELERLGAQIPPDSKKIDLGDLSLSLLDAKLAQLTSPRREGVPPLTRKAFMGKDKRDAALALAESVVTEKLGSVEKAYGQGRQAAPIIFGAYTGRTIDPAQPEPSLRLEFRLRLPGQIVETNGKRDLDGAVAWNFANEDLALTGGRMWARSIMLNTSAISKLKLGKFANSLAAVEALRRVMVGSAGKLDADLASLLRLCIAQGSLKPLQDAANAASTSTKASPQEAARLLEVLTKFSGDMPQDNDEGAVFDAGVTEPEVIPSEIFTSSRQAGQPGSTGASAVQPPKDGVKDKE